MVFCNKIYCDNPLFDYIVTILILVDGFLQYRHWRRKNKKNKVTILILVDGFLQLYVVEKLQLWEDGHNPYFSRWFSAIPI